MPVGNIFLGRRYLPGENVAALLDLIEEAREQMLARAGKRFSAFGEVEE